MELIGCKVFLSPPLLLTVTLSGSLMYLNEATLLYNLRVRYNRNQIYVSMQTPSPLLGMIGTTHMQIHMHRGQTCMHIHTWI